MAAFASGKSADLHKVKLDNGFFSRIATDVRTKVIPYQWRALNDEVPDAEPSHCIENYRIAAGRQQGEFHGFVFQDSDLAKWLEAVSYSLTTDPDPALERTADEAIDLIAAAQQADGYLDTYFTIKEPQKRWTNLRDCHELYCAGHMMEAAVAYYEATGKRKLLDVMTRMAEHILGVLGAEESKLHGYPGHPEIELALVRLYHATGDKRMLALSQYFIDERGKKPYYFVTEQVKREGAAHFSCNDDYGMIYFQAHKPVREQEQIVGHSVRALYLLSGMIDVARETGDHTLLQSAKRLFDNCINKRMYVTGGVGSTVIGEAFTLDYDLPNDTVYAETCASIALCFAAYRLALIEPDRVYMDAFERALYNTCIAGMSLEGDRFFYVNPLEVTPENDHADPTKKHVLPVRPKWFGCACCPPNLARLIASLGQYIYSTSENELYVHLYIGGQATLTLLTGNVTIQQKTEYPYQGDIQISLSHGEYTLCLRLPAWCTDYSLRINDKESAAEQSRGYLKISRVWQDGDTVTLNLAMPPRRVYANPRVNENIGKVCVMRGPLCYCAEEADNGKALQQLVLPRDSELHAVAMPQKLGGIVELRTKALCCSDSGDTLYTSTPPVYDRQIELTLIPYYAWANRGENEMRVWLYEG